MPTDVDRSTIIKRAQLDFRLLKERYRTRAARAKRKYEGMSPSPQRTENKAAYMVAQRKFEEVTRVLNIEEETGFLTKPEELELPWNFFVRRPGNPPPSPLQYNIMRQIGQGNFGRVYQATREGDPIKENYFAIKLLLTSHPDPMKNLNRVLRFNQEVRIMRTIDDLADYFPTIYCADRLPSGLPFYVMKYYPISLAHIIESNDGIPTAVAREILLKLCLAMEVARLHDCSFSHRDLKPGNIALEQLPNREINPILLDWGLAKPLEASDLDYALSTQSLRREVYVSRTPPEYPNATLQSNANHDHDIYALGTIFYEMAKGEAPFILTQKNKKGYKRGAHHRRLSRPHSMPEADFRLAERMMAFNPSDRPGSFLRVIRAIEELPPA